MGPREEVKLKLLTKYDNTVFGGKQQYLKAQFIITQIIAVLGFE